MKVRTNKRRVLARLAVNRKAHWFLAPILKRAAEIAERGRRIKAIVDKSFPEFA